MDAMDDNAGRHNQDLEHSVARLHKGRTYEDLTTVMVVPTRGDIPAKVVGSWMSLMRPMNQVCAGPEFFAGFEVGDAYNRAVEGILATNVQIRVNKGRPFRYMLTLEDDNLPPPDGILRLMESIKEHDVVGGLYWTKGEEGQPMIYGNPSVLPRNFVPQPPLPQQVQRCNGLGMGFTLFRVDLLEKMAPDLPKNDQGVRQWFKTVQEWSPDKGGKAFTQDLWFFDQAAKYGARVASDNRVLVGHYDKVNDVVW